MRRSLVLLAALGLPATAWAWPADEAWLDFTRGGALLEDAPYDHGGGAGSVDIVGEIDEAAAAAAWYVDDDFLYLRMRVSDDPWFVEDSTLRSGAWAFLLETDGDTADVEWVLGMSGFAAPTLTVWENSVDEGGGVSDPAEDPRQAWTASEAPVRITVATTTLGAEYDYLVDMAFPRGELETVLGTDLDGTFQVVVATAADNALALLADDVAGSSTAGAVVDALTDPIGLDQDGDGLSDSEEYWTGTDPVDADTDDDGLGDEEEAEGATSPIDCDSDFDGLPDGLELGVTQPGDGTDTTTGCFVADTDPATTTDPMVGDTDAGSLGDGTEDRDADGAIGEWETDPNDPSDDVDVDDTDGIPDVLEDLCGGADRADHDGDGHADTEEGLADSDGDGLPDFCDDDDDDDGLPTAEEGEEDTDGDGAPDWQDPDSDNDGQDDGDEGTGDGDCDGVPDHLDLVEDDGPCGDPDGDGVTNEDEQACGSATDAADTDADGIPDGEEPCDEDADCDQVPDRLDATHNEGECDDDDGDTGPVTDCDPDDAFLDCGRYTGGACSVVTPDLAMLPALLAALAVLRRRGVRLAATGVGLGALGLPWLVPAARAQEAGLDVQRFRPTPDSRSTLGLEDTTAAGDGLGGQVMFNYADEPLVWRMDDGQETPIVGALGTFDVAAFWTAKMVRVGVDLPLHTTGTTAFHDAGFRPGDLRLDAKLTFMDRKRSLVGLATVFDVALPTGDEASWLGASGPDFGGRVAVGFGRKASLVANLGGRFTKAVELYPDLAWGPRLTWGLGAHLPVSPTVHAIAELDGERAFDNTADVPGATPTEARLGARLLPTKSLVVTTAAGMGISQGVGTPDYRLIAGVAWVPPREKAVVDGGADRDGDGIKDTLDACPDQPEDKNGRNDTDGCPDAGLTPTRLEVKDPRGARVAGAVLEIVSGPEAAKYTLPSGEMTRSLRPGTYQVRVSAEGYEGDAADMRVPDADRHEHSFTVKPAMIGGEVIVTVKNADGEPLAALVSVVGAPRKWVTGADGVGAERLPPGFVELQVWAERYRPARFSVEVGKDRPARVDAVLQEARARLTAERVEIDDKVYFDFDKATIKAESFNLLDDVATILVNHPEVRRVEVQGHTDDTGDDAYNMKLSQARAQSVVDFLVQRGVERQRLIAKGYGETAPAVPNDGDTNREANRRVVFQIVATDAPAERQKPPPPPDRPRRGGR